MKNKAYPPPPLPPRATRPSKWLIRRTFRVGNLCCHCDVSVGTTFGGTPGVTAGQEAASELVATSELHIQLIFRLEFKEGFFFSL